MDPLDWLGAAWHATVATIGIAFRAEQLQRVARRETYGPPLYLSAILAIYAGWTPPVFYVVVAVVGWVGQLLLWRSDHLADEAVRATYAKGW